MVRKSTQISTSESESDLSQFYNESDVESDVTSTDETDGSDSETKKVCRSKGKKQPTQNEREWQALEEHEFTRLPCKFDQPISKLELNDNAEPIEYFRQFIDNHVVDFVCYQSNHYRVLNNWKFPKIMPCDLLAWLGINFLRGYHRLPSTESYWSLSDDLGVDLVRNSMSRDRYQQITRSLHLAENDLIPDRKSPDYDPIYKIRRFARMLNQKFLDNMSCSARLSIDESMIKFKGRSSCKQYFPLKPIKRGFKVWSLCDSETGYLYKFDIYCGKKASESSSMESVVLNLL